MKALAIGCGAAGHAGSLPTFVALARTADLHVLVLDRATLQRDHLEHPLYRDHGQPGLPKASALAARLRDAGIDATPLHGDLTRWPLSVFRADLALVGLDSESARRAAHARLREARTPSLCIGLRDVVGVHAFGVRADDACYECGAQRFVPTDPTPCMPEDRSGPPAATPAGQRVAVSTRRLATPDALRSLGERLPELSRRVLAGRELGTYRVIGPGDRHVRALLPRNPRCGGNHVARPAPTGCYTVAASTPLASLFTSVGDDAQLDGCCIRAHYLCRDCGRSDQGGRDLARSWPLRERCGCGSAAVEPLLRLDTINRAEAERQSLLHESLQDLGMPPGWEFTARDRDSAIAVHVGDEHEGAALEPAHGTPSAPCTR